MHALIVSSKSVLNGHTMMHFVTSAFYDCSNAVGFSPSYSDFWGLFA